MPMKLGVKGGVTSQPRRETPRLWVFGPSFNSAKAHLCLRISSVWRSTEVRMIDIQGQNYTPEYASINPNMTAPTCEIDDKLITDSDILASYLREHYAGAGDRKVVAAGKSGEMQKMMDLVLRWDEGMYTYGTMSGDKGGGMGYLVNKLRGLRLRQQCVKAAGAPEKKLWDGRTLTEAYETKIAYIEDLSRQVDSAMTTEKTAAFARNAAVQAEICALASRLVESSGGSGFLFGPDLTTADAFLAPLLFRVGQMDKAGLESIFVQFPALRAYWGRFEACDEGRVVTKYTMRWAFRFAAGRCIPCSILGMKLGCLGAPALPAPTEERIKRLLSKMQAA